MELVRVCEVDSNRGLADVELWRASTVPDLCVVPATTRTTDVVVKWASDLHYFEMNSPLTAVSFDQLLALVCTVPVQRGFRRWCVRISTVGARCLLRVIPSLETAPLSLVANVRESATHADEGKTGDSNSHAALENVSPSNSDDIDMEDGSADLEDQVFDDLPKTFLLPRDHIDEIGNAIQVTDATWGLRIAPSPIKGLGIFNTDDDYQGPLRIFPLLGRIVPAGLDGTPSQRVSLNERRKAYGLPGSVCREYLPSCPHGPHPPSLGPFPLLPKGYIFPPNFCRRKRGRQCLSSIVRRRRVQCCIHVRSHERVQ